MIKKIKMRGITLVELIVVIVIVSVAVIGVMRTLASVLSYAPQSYAETVAVETATRCIEWYIGQQYINGFTSIICPSTTVPTYCVAPAGYTLAVSVSCSPFSDANYRSITVTVGGRASEVLSVILGK